MRCGPKLSVDLPADQIPFLNPHARTAAVLFNKLDCGAQVLEKELIDKDHFVGSAKSCSVGL